MKQQIVLVVLPLFMAAAVANNVVCGNSVCGANNLCCGNNRCYDPNTHDCINGQLCGKGNGVCKGNVCYDPNVAVCFPSPCFGSANPDDTSHDVLCGKGLAACGSGNGKPTIIKTYEPAAICYDPNLYFCAQTVPPSIQQRKVAFPPSGNIICSATPCPPPLQCCIGRAQTSVCYDPRNSTCEIDARGNGRAIVCPIGFRNKAQHACQTTTIDNLVCYNPDLQVCCHNDNFVGTPTINATVITRGHACPGSNTQCVVF